MRHTYRTSIGTLCMCVVIAWAAGCAREAGSESTPGDIQAADFTARKMRVVATTNIVGDLVRQVGGEQVELATLMGPGVDPHLYQASEGDVQRLSEADLILYNGLDLEGKMTEIFAQMRQRGVPAVAVADAALADSLLIASEEYAGNYDPHVWFDVGLWADVARHVGDVLARRDTAHAEQYRARAEAYAGQLRQLDAHVVEQTERVPAEQRVLITSHDAFSYFGRAYGFEVRGLQGISTASEAGAADVQRLARLIAEQRIPAIFAETSVSPRGIEAVQQAVQARGFEVDIGGTLYGDALGDAGTPAGTYEGAVRHNVDAITGGLLQEDASTPTASGTPAASSTP